MARITRLQYLHLSGGATRAPTQVPEWRLRPALQTRPAHPERSLLRAKFYLDNRGHLMEQLASEGHPIRQEDVARLSPLVFDHINLLGRYAFSVPDSVARGQLSPLRNPTDALEDVV